MWLPQVHRGTVCGHGMLECSATAGLEPRAGIHSTAEGHIAQGSELPSLRVRGRTKNRSTQRLQTKSHMRGLQKGSSSIRNTFKMSAAGFGEMSKPPIMPAAQKHTPAKDPSVIQCSYRGHELPGIPLAHRQIQETTMFRAKPRQGRTVADPSANQYDQGGKPASVSGLVQTLLTQTRDNDASAHVSEEVLDWSDHALPEAFSEEPWDSAALVQPMPLDLMESTDERYADPMGRFRAEQTTFGFNRDASMRNKASSKSGEPLLGESLRKDNAGGQRQRSQEDRGCKPRSNKSQCPASIHLDEDSADTNGSVPQPTMPGCIVDAIGSSFHKAVEPDSNGSSSIHSNGGGKCAVLASCCGEPGAHGGGGSPAHGGPAHGGPPQGPPRFLRNPRASVDESPGSGAVADNPEHQKRDSRVIVPRSVSQRLSAAVPGGEGGGVHVASSSLVAPGLGVRRRLTIAAQSPHSSRSSSLDTNEPDGQPPAGLERRSLLRASLTGGGVTLAASAPAAGPTDQKAPTESQESSFEHAVVLAKVHSMTVPEVRKLWEEFHSLQVIDGMLPRPVFDGLVRRRCNLGEGSSIPNHLYIAGDLSRGGAVNFENFLLWTVETAYSEEVLVPDLAERKIRQLARDSGFCITDVESVKRVFDKFDVDSSGYIEKHEFHHCLFVLMNAKSPSDVSEKKMQRYWREADIDNSGEISFEEFLLWYSRCFIHENAALFDV